MAVNGSALLLLFNGHYSDIEFPLVMNNINITGEMD